MTNPILALDFGGTKHTVALAARDSTTWLDYRRIVSESGDTAAQDRGKVIALAREMLGGQQPAEIGVSFGGPVDFAAGVVRLSHHVPGWEGVRLREILQIEFDAPVVVDNDANAGALGEFHFGAGRGSTNLLYVTVSTGVGGGWIVEGRPYRGAESMAGEIGHMVVDMQGPMCLCGKRGCVERLASGPYMVQDALEKLRRDIKRKSSLRSLLQEEKPHLTAERLNSAAEEGDSLASEIVERGATALGIGLGNAANLMSPDLIVLGGGVSKSGQLWWDALRRIANETVLPEIPLEIVPAELGDDAPLWGAVSLSRPDKGPSQ